ncbi:MAG TPA: ankyrin repeat domain-containing protein [Candidatus Wallbacteria bacterium]|nr:ankyrin repeat domain-containing protein [Candidatus Wallbacteria bacterium]
MKKILLVAIVLLLICGGAARAENTFDDLKKKAASGDAAALGLLGEAYSCGWNGAPKDDKKAVECFEKAAAQGDPVGQYYMGTIFYFGNTVNKDYKKAAEWFEKAALHGEIRAQGNIAMMYYEGTDFPQNNIMAYAYYNIIASGPTADPISKKAAAESLDKLQKKMSPQQIDKAKEKSRDLLKKIDENFKKTKITPAAPKYPVNTARILKTDEIFIEAVSSLDIKTINELIKKGYKIKDLPSDYAPVLITVIGSQNANFARFMGAKAEAAKGYTEESLKKSVAAKKNVVFKLLAENGAECNIANSGGEKLIALAAATGDSEIVKYLLAKKSDVTNLNKNGDDLLYCAIGSHSLETVKTVVESAYGPGLIKSGARSAARAATLKEDGILKYLIEKGININGNTGSAAGNESGNNSSWKPLKAALYNKNIDALKLLIEKGADLKIINKNGENCLFELTGGITGDEMDDKTVEIAKMLVARGVTANIKNNSGETVLMMAARNGSVPFMKFLIENGSDVNARNNNGITAMGYAKKARQQNSIAFLNSVNAVE